MLLLTTPVPHETPSDHENQQHNNSQSLNDETPCTSSQCQDIETGPSVSTHKDMCASITAKLLGSGVPIQNLWEICSLAGLSIELTPTHRRVI